MPTLNTCLGTCIPIAAVVLAQSVSAECPGPGRVRTDEDPAECILARSPDLRPLERASLEARVALEAGDRPAAIKVYSRFIATAPAGLSDPLVEAWFIDDYIALINEAGDLSGQIALYEEKFRRARLGGGYKVSTVIYTYVDILKRAGKSADHVFEDALGMPASDPYRVDFALSFARYRLFSPQAIGSAIEPARIAMASLDAQDLPSSDIRASGWDRLEMRASRRRLIATTHVSAAWRAAHP